MFAASTTQPLLTQLLAPLSQALGTLNGIRSSSSISRVCSQTAAATSNSSTAFTEETNKQANAAIQTIENTLQELGLSDLPKSIDFEDLNPFLNCSGCEKENEKQINPHWRTSYISADTFFENKNGFPESDLKKNSSLLSRSVHQFIQTIHQSQTRGFKTRSRGSLGLGTLDAEHSKSLKGLRLAVMDRVSPREKKPDQLKVLLSQYEGSPEVQEKIKVAFAEGYSSTKRPEPEGIGKRIYRFILAGILIWLAIQLLPLYGALGGKNGKTQQNIKMNVMKGDKYEVSPQDINVTFADVKGVDEAKQELKDVVEYLRSGDKFRSLGAKLPKGVLLVGPPGNGKTLLARAVAGEAGVPFFHASGSEFDEIFVGTGAKRIRQLFEAAKAKAPCVIFIDEIDTVGAKRTSSQIHPYANQTINQLLSEMDGFAQNEGIIVLGATNRKGHLDNALLRPGRFDVEVNVFLPDLKGRTEILALYLDKIKSAPDVKPDIIAKQTTGCSGADLENIINQAALKAAMETSDRVFMRHISFAIDKNFMGPAKKNKIPDEETNWNTAFHEAGHALVSYYTKDATPLHKVTIIPRGQSLGHTSFLPEKDVYSNTKAQLLARMDVSMGGRIGEELGAGLDKITTGASSDFNNATSIATAMVKYYGMSEKVGVRVYDSNANDAGLNLVKVNEISQKESETIDDEIKRLLQESYDRAKTLLRSHASEHKALAAALMKYETLDAEEVKLVLDGKKIKRTI